MTTGLRNLLAQGRTWHWGAPAVVWMLFSIWYTNTAGPLTMEEIDAFIAQAERGGAGPERVEFLRRFMTEDTGDQFLMVNLLEMAEPDPSRADTPEESLARYMDHMYPELFKRACHPVLAGPVVHDALDLVGIDGAEQWSTVGVMRYRSRRDLLEIAFNPVFDSKHEFKIAALEKTVAVPVEPYFFFGDLRTVTFLFLFFLLAVTDALTFRRRTRPD